MSSPVLLFLAVFCPGEFVTRSLESPLRWWDRRVPARLRLAGTLQTTSPPHAGSSPAGSPAPCPAGRFTSRRGWAAVSVGPPRGGRALCRAAGVPLREPVVRGHDAGRYPHPSCCRGRESGSWSPSDSQRSAGFPSRGRIYHGNVSVCPRGGCWSASCAPAASQLLQQLHGCLFCSFRAPRDASVSLLLFLPISRAPRRARSMARIHTGAQSSISPGKGFAKLLLCNPELHWGSFPSSNPAVSNMHVSKMNQVPWV